MDKRTIRYSDSLTAFDRFETTIRPHFYLIDDIALAVVDDQAI